MEQIKIREATDVDVGDIQCLLQQEEDWHRTMYPDYFVDQGSKVPSDELLVELNDPECRYILAVDGTEVVGLVILKVKVFSNEPQFKKVEFVIVEDCIVREDHRGHGIGTKLMKQAKEWATSKGISRMQLQVWARNDKAVRLYEALGYKSLVIRMELK